MIYCWLGVEKARRSPPLAQCFQQQIAQVLLFCYAQQILSPRLLPGQFTGSSLQQGCSSSADHALHLLPSSVLASHTEHRAHTAVSSHFREVKQSTAEEEEKKTESFPQPPQVSQESKRSPLKAHKASRKTVSYSYLQVWWSKLLRSYSCFWQLGTLHEAILVVTRFPYLIVSFFIN